MTYVNVHLNESIDLKLVHIIYKENTREICEWVLFWRKIFSKEPSVVDF